MTVVIPIATFNDEIEIVVVLFLEVKEYTEDDDRVPGVARVVDGVADVAAVGRVEVDEMKLHGSSSLSINKTGLDQFKPVFHHIFRRYWTKLTPPIFFLIIDWLLKIFSGD